MTEDKMVGWHHQLNGHEFEQILRNSEGQGSLVCCSPWSHKESDTATEQPQITHIRYMEFPCINGFFFFIAEYFPLSYLMAKGKDSKSKEYCKIIDCS